jgi:hypothetical protein
MIELLSPPPDDPRLLGEEASADTAALDAAAIEEEPGTLLRNVTPSKAFISQDYCYTLLRPLVPEGELAGWESVAGEVAETAVNILKIQIYALGIALAGVMLAGGGFGMLLMHDPDLRENLWQLALGALEWVKDSWIASAESVLTMLASNLALGTMAPVTAVVMVCGALYQTLVDLWGAMELAWQVLGHAAELDDLAARGLEIFCGMMRGMLEGGLGTQMHQFGYEMAKQAAGQMKKDLVIPLDFKNPISTSNIEALLTYCFNVGTYIGQIVIDVIMTILGIEFIPLLIKGLKATGIVLEALQKFVLELLRRVDSGLADDLLAFAARAAGAVDARVARFVEDMAERAGYSRADLEKGFAFLKSALKEEEYNAYAGTLFCSLPVGG